MTQPLAEPDGLTANQRRDRVYLGEFLNLQRYIKELAAEKKPSSVRLIHAKLDLELMVKRAPHLFELKDGKPQVRETQG